MSLVSEQEVVPSFSGAVSIFESAHAFENIVTLIWKTNYEILARHLETCSVDSYNKIQSLQNKKHKLQLQKTQDEYQPKFHWPNHEGFQKTSAKNRSLTPALANETGPARQLS